MNSDIVCIDGEKYRCKFINNDTIEIPGITLRYASNKKVCEFLSNKNIIVDECNSEAVFVAQNITNSHITIKKLILYYQSEYFEYYPEDRILKEKTELLDCKLENDTTILVEGYYMNSGLNISVFVDKLYEEVNSMIRNKNNDEEKKITFIHSDKLIDISSDLKRCFKY